MENFKNWSNLKKRVTKNSTYDARFLNGTFEAPNAIEVLNFKALSFLKYTFNPPNDHIKDLKAKRHFQNTYYKLKIK